MVCGVELRGSPESYGRPLPRRNGNFSNVKSVGSGVFECKIHFGAGYRAYFGKDGERIVIVLGGGTKKTQQSDIALAIRRWDDYKHRKKQGKEQA
jgi:putative addiction module killer protein